MERIEKDYGYLLMEDGKIYGYYPSSSDQGYIYKDFEAFKSGEGICYISEYGIQELNEELADLEARHENITDPDDENFLSDEEYLEERADILRHCGETRQTIIDQILEAYGEDYMLTDEQAEYLAEQLLYEADWAYICTYIAEDMWIDDAIEFADITRPGLFTRHQHEAVMEGQTPSEYADRQLSYGELAELDEEFDTAFIVDEDCHDDKSEKGLGANARLTYIEERRIGLISGPAEFDCPEEFRK